MYWPKEIWSLHPFGTTANLDTNEDVLEFEHCCKRKEGRGEGRKEGKERGGKSVGGIMALGNWNPFCGYNSTGLQGRTW